MLTLVYVRYCGTKSRTQKTLLVPLLDRFLSMQSAEDLYFSVWGHGYEFDFGTEKANWGRLVRFCEKVAAVRDVICCSNSAFFEAAIHSRDTK